MGITVLDIFVDGCRPSVFFDVVGILRIARKSTMYFYEFHYHVVL
jgi:hypothetical protein